MNRLIRQLKREIKARPGKAALLGVLALIAAAVGLPRLWGLVSLGEATTSAPPEAAAVTVSPEAQAPARAQLAWHELAALIEQSRAMQPVLAKLPGGRDPFATLATMSVPQEPEDSEQRAALDQSPSELGLKLTSTAIGPRRSLAVISGKVYEQGARVPAAQAAEFELVEIHRELVVLVRGGRRYELKISRRERSGTVSVRPTP